MVNKIGIYSTKKKQLYLDKVAEMHRKGIEVPEIAQEIPVSESTLYRWVEIMDLKGSGELEVTAQRKRQPRKAKPEKPAVPKADGMREIAKSMKKQIDEEDVVATFGGNSNNSEDKNTDLIESMTREIKRLKKRLVDEAIKSATLESVLNEKEGDSKKDGDPQKVAQPDQEELQKQIKELRGQLKYEHMRAEAYDAMIDIAEEKLGVDIRKKPVAKQ